MARRAWCHTPYPADLSPGRLPRLRSYGPGVCRPGCAGHGALGAGRRAGQKHWGGPLAARQRHGSDAALGTRADGTSYLWLAATLFSRGGCGAEARQIGAAGVASTRAQEGSCAGLPVSYRSGRWLRSAVARAHLVLWYQTRPEPLSSFLTRVSCAPLFLPLSVAQRQHPG